MVSFNFSAETLVFLPHTNQVELSLFFHHKCSDVTGASAGSGRYSCWAQSPHRLSGRCVVEKHSTYHRFIHLLNGPAWGILVLEVNTPCGEQISTLNCATGKLASKKVDVPLIPLALEGQGLQGGHARYTRERGQPADLTEPLTRASSSTQATRQGPSFKVPFSQSGASQGHPDRGHTMS